MCSLLFLLQYLLEGGLSKGAVSVAFLALSVALKSLAEVRGNRG